MAFFSLEGCTSIVDLLQCPVCLTTMKPPIYQCRNGHCVCGECKERVEDCPTCRGAFIDTRNLIAELLANKVRYHCKNTFRGCNEKTHLKDMEKHESVCPHRMYHCLVAKDNGCTWTGPRSGIVAHTKEKHNKNIRTTSSIYRCTGDYIFDIHRMNCIFLFGEEIFWYRSKSDAQKKRFYGDMQYIGPAGNASKYVYEHRLVSPSGDKKLIFENVVKSEADELENMLELRKCFVMEYDTLKMFAQNGKGFEYTVKVCKQE
jgi:E3 ubiquitin-protein ligase SIAH1